MKYTSSESAGALIVNITGILDFSCNEEFEVMLDSLKASKPRKVVIDLSGVSSLDSVGLGLLFIAKEEFTDIQCQFSLRRPQGAVARLLNLSNARMTFSIET